MPTVFTSSLSCPKCGERRSDVTNSRGIADATYIRRRRRCKNGHVFSTQERAIGAWGEVDKLERRAIYERIVKVAADILEVNEREPFP